MKIHSNTFLLSPPYALVLYPCDQDRARDEFYQLDDAYLCFWDGARLRPLAATLARDLLHFLQRAVRDALSGSLEIFDLFPRGVGALWSDTPLGDAEQGMLLRARCRRLHDGALLAKDGQLQGAWVYTRHGQIYLEVASLGCPAAHRVQDGHESPRTQYCLTAIVSISRSKALRWWRMTRRLTRWLEREHGEAPNDWLAVQRRRRRWRTVRLMRRVALRRRR